MLQIGCQRFLRLLERKARSVVYLVLYHFVIIILYRLLIEHDVSADYDPLSYIVHVW